MKSSLIIFAFSIASTALQAQSGLQQFVRPLPGSLSTRSTAFATPFSHTGEIAQFTIEKADSFYLLVRPNSDQQKGFVQIDAARQEISGYNPVHRIYQGWTSG